MNKYNLVKTLAFLIGVSAFGGDLKCMDAHDKWHFNQELIKNTLPANDYALIKNTTNPDNLKELLLLIVGRNYHSSYSMTMTHAMARIDALNRTHNPKIRFNNTDNTSDTLERVIGHYDRIVDEYGNRTEKLNLELPQFVTWFINHGIPITKDAMRVAIDKNRIDIVSILRRQGIDPTAPSSEANKSRTFIEYARVYNKLTIASILTSKEENHSNAWYIALTMAARRNEHVDLQVAGGRRAATTNDLLDDLSRLGDIDFSEIVSKFNSAEQKKVKEYLNTRKPIGYQQRIYIIDKLPQASSTSFLRSKTTAGIIAAALTLSAFYKWFTRNPAQHQQKNSIINKTGAPLFIDGQTIAANATFALPQKGVIRIKLMQNQDASKDLVINIDAYTDDLNDSYLNLIIYKKWFSRLFTVPLTKSEVWIDKTEAVD